MCNPTYASMGTSLLGTVGSAVGKYYQGSAEADRLNFDAGVLDSSAANADIAADDVEASGRRDANKYRQKVKLMVGRQKAAFGGSGIDVNTGAAADILEETVLHGEDDATMIRRNAAMEAYGIRTRAADYRTKARLSRIAAKDRKRAGTNRAVSTLLSGAGSVASTYSDYLYAKGY